MDGVQCQPSWPGFQLTRPMTPSSRMDISSRRATLRPGTGQQGEPCEAVATLEEDAVAVGAP